MSMFTDENELFRSPEHAAAHAVMMQGGFSTPARECRRMLAGIRHAMMRCCAHCPEDCPSRLRCPGCGWTMLTEQFHYEHALAVTGSTDCMSLPRQERVPHPAACGQCGERPQAAYDRRPALEGWLASRGLALDGTDEPTDWMKGWKP
jgi:hypothetical protein